jgi:uncharacterized protein YwgA
MHFSKQAIILEMIHCLCAQGSRTGKTHIIKGLFLAHAARLCKVPFSFFLYKHGPYSTDIEANLEEMQAYGAIKMEPAHDGYGVLFIPDEMADYLKKKVPISQATRKGLEKVSSFMKSKNVADLERVATAAWIRTCEGEKDNDAVSARLHELKPHISLNDAYKADEEVRQFLDE